MKKIIFYSAILFLLIGCNSNKRDWEKAKNLDTLVGYKDFLSKHSDGEFTQKALTAVDSLEWKEALTTLDTLKLRDYIKNHSNGAYLENAKLTLDSIEWKEVLSSRDSSKIKIRIKNNPTSKYIEQANEILWKIEWPPVKVEKANSVIIYSKGMGIIHGQMMFSMRGMFNGGGLSDPIPVEPAVYIWRDFSKDEANENMKLGLRPGYAYLMPEKRKFKLIRKIDLNKSDNELLAEFGVSSK